MYGIIDNDNLSKTGAFILSCSSVTDKIDKLIEAKTYEIKTDGNENVTETPNTSDNILLYVFTSVISVAGVVVLACISKKEKILSLR